MRRDAILVFLVIAVVVGTVGSLVWFAHTESTQVLPTSRFASYDRVSSADAVSYLRHSLRESLGYSATDTMVNFFHYACEDGDSISTVYILHESGTYLRPHCTSYMPIPYRVFEGVLREIESSGYDVIQDRTPCYLCLKITVHR